eukprot:NODE_1519_length_829_cov_86.227920_g1471_i0.p1 GENE.NODE_1519_length_829_cov_86.227920_g1471_i0~~NODE_1519_length_829_cov_86.227920_g1471_i0.p1  ORF type:complete len:113 (+),score=4.84 NODE_1519_length_829_cov_86.227920_g1471_i0:355-693(+)
MSMRSAEVPLRGLRCDSTQQDTVCVTPIPPMSRKTAPPPPVYAEIMRVTMLTTLTYLPAGPATHGFCGNPHTAEPNIEPPTMWTSRLTPQRARVRTSIVCVYPFVVLSALYG